MRLRYLSVFAAAAITAGCNAPSSSGGTGTAADEQAIRTIGPAFATAMNSKDMKAFGTLLDSTYEEVEPDGSHLVGVQATVDKMTQEMSAMPPMQMTGTTTFVKFLSATTAVAGGTYTTAAAAGMPATRGAWSATVVKRDSTWKMVSSLGANDDSELMKMASMDSMAPSKAMPKKKGK